MWLKAIRFSEDDVLVLADLHLHPSWMCWLVLHSLGDTGVYKHIGLAELVCVDFLTCDVEHVPQCLSKPVPLRGGHQSCCLLALSSLKQL